MPLWRSDERLGPLPDWFSDILDVVLSDFQQPAVIDLGVGYDAARQMVVFSEPGETSSAGFGAPATHTRSPDAEEIVEVAFWLQDQFFPETRGAWGEPRPRCPGHAHPMAPVEIDGEAWWTCPVDDRAVVRIGAFRG
jgi:hypothetical protein